MVACMRSSMDWRLYTEIPGIKSSSFEELGGLDVKLGAALEEVYVR